MESSDVYKANTFHTIQYDTWRGNLTDTISQGQVILSVMTMKGFLTLPSSPDQELKHQMQLSVGFIPIWKRKRIFSFILRVVISQGFDKHACTFMIYSWKRKHLIRTTNNISHVLIYHKITNIRLIKTLVLIACEPSWFILCREVRESLSLYLINYIFRLSVSKEFFFFFTHGSNPYELAQSNVVAEYTDYISAEG